MKKLVASLTLIFTLAISSTVFAGNFDAKVTLNLGEGVAKSNSTHLSNNYAIELHNYTVRAVNYYVKRVGKEQTVMQGTIYGFQNSNLPGLIKHPDDYNLTLLCTTGSNCSAFGAIHDF